MSPRTAGADVVQYSRQTRSQQAPSGYPAFEGLVPRTIYYNRRWEGPSWSALSLAPATPAARFAADPISRRAPVGLQAHPAWRSCLV